MKAFKIIIPIIIIIFILSFSIASIIRLYDYVFNPNSNIVLNYASIYIISIVIFASTAVYVVYKLIMYLKYYLHKPMSFDRFKKEI